MLTISNEEKKYLNTTVCPARLLFTFLLLVPILFFVDSSLAQVTNDQNNKVKAKVVKDSKKPDSNVNNNPTLANLNGGGSGWRLQGSLTHTPKLRNDQEDVSSLLFRGDYNINKSHSIRVTQFFTKFYAKYSSEYEFKAFDTTIGYFYRLPWKPKGIGLQLRNSISLPISNESQRDSLYTAYRLSLLGSKSFLKGKLLVFGIPYGRYFLYKYKTSVDGRLLPRYQYGLSLGSLYFWTSKISTYVGGDYRVEGVYHSQFDSSPKQVPQGVYRFDVDLSYQVTNALTTSLSYAQGWASYIQDGRYELALFDDQASRVSLGLTYIY